jgi:hypothetical protein
LNNTEVWLASQPGTRLQHVFIQQS